MDRLPLPLLSLGVALLVGALAALGVVRALRRARLRARFGRARQREADAVRILERAGYRVVADQVTAGCALRVDGVPVPATVRADYLVRRWGRLWVAEAKSGARATDPADRATRRQLLEYAVSYDVAGVLLVDTEAGRVGRVEFPALRARAGPGFWSGLAVGFLVGAALLAAITGLVPALGWRSGG